MCTNEFFFFSGIVWKDFFVKLYPHGHMVNIQKLNLGNFIEKRSLGAFFYCPRSRFFFQFDRGIKALNIWGWVKTYYYYCMTGNQHPFTNYLRFHQGTGFWLIPISVYNIKWWNDKFAMSANMIYDDIDVNHREQCCDACKQFLSMLRF